LNIDRLIKDGFVLFEKQKPQSEQKVYLICEETLYNGKISHFQTMGIYIPYMTVKEGDYMSDEFWGDGDYNEEKDEYYTPEGFYEYCSAADINYHLSCKVLMWKPLIKL